MDYYIGSCRYQPYFKEFFGPRLHTTKEILYLLENINNLENLLTTLPGHLIPYIFGDLCFNDVDFLSVEYFKKTPTSFGTLFIEISSRKVFMYGNIPVNNYYIQTRCPQYTQFLTYHHLTDDDIENDILKILNIHKNIVIITHFAAGIPDRQNLIDALEHICKKHNIRCFNPSGLLPIDSMPDGTHYKEEKYDVIREGLTSASICKI